MWRPATIAGGLFGAEAFANKQPLLALGHDPWSTEIRRTLRNAEPQRPKP